MKIVRIVLSVLAGLILISFITESIEFLIVKLASGQSMEYLSTNQNLYFEVRNQTGILIAKMFYTSLSAVIAGIVTTLIAKSAAKMAIGILATLQTVSLIWAGFLSDLSSTGPVWMWVALIILVPTSIFLGHRLKAQ